MANPNGTSQPTSLSQSSSSSTKTSILTLLYTTAFAVVVAYSVFLRFWHLDNIPGINGDETFTGINALHLLRHQSVQWITPSGKLTSPIGLLLAVLVQLFMPASPEAIRIPALIAGLGTIVLAAVIGPRILGRWAAAGMVLLIAAIPENIIQCHISWEPSESVISVLFALYCSTMILIDSLKPAKWVAWSIAALLLAVACHPTNIFVAVFLFGALLIRFGPTIKSTVLPSSPTSKTYLAWAICLLTIAVFAKLAGKIIIRGVTALATTNSFIAFPVFFAHFLNGITGMRYVAGSFMDGEVPTATIWTITWIILAIVFLPILACLILGAMRKLILTDTDRLLLWGWLALVVSFEIVAGTNALTPGLERYGLVLIAPTVAAVCKAFDLLTTGRNGARSLVAVGGLGISVGLLFFIYSGMFVYMLNTGGTAHPAFWTGQIDPKYAAWAAIEQENSNSSQKGVILSSEYWNALPLSYFSQSDPNSQITVVLDNQVTNQGEKETIANAGQTGHLWLVEYTGSPKLEAIESQLKAQEIPYTDVAISGYGNRQILDVIHISRGGASASL